MMEIKDIFHDDNGKEKVLIGVATTLGSTKSAELAGMVGFDLIWIDIEHAASGFENAESLCVSAKAGGTIPLIRTCDAQRTHVLRALEIGAKIVVVPMVNDAETTGKVVEHGKFPPVGKRGFNTRTRGLNYGLAGIPGVFEIANKETHLFIQIETKEAVKNVDSICAVQGLSGLFIGPGDLSADFGKPGQFQDKEIIDTAVHCIKRARQHGKYAGILGGVGEMVKSCVKAGANIVIIGSDMGEICNSFTKLLDSAKLMLKEI